MSMDAVQESQQGPDATASATPSAGTKTTRGGRRVVTRRVTLRDIAQRKAAKAAKNTPRASEDQKISEVPNDVQDELSVSEAKPVAQPVEVGLQIIYFLSDFQGGGA